MNFFLPKVFHAQTDERSVLQALLHDKSMNVTISVRSSRLNRLVRGRHHCEVVSGQTIADGRDEFVDLRAT